MILYKKAYSQLLERIHGYTEHFRYCLVEGDYGKGKSTLIQQALKSFDAVILDVKQYPGMNTPYEALSSALLQLLEDKAYKPPVLNLELSHREYIKQMCITICRQMPGIILHFEDIRDYETILIELINEILIYLERRDTPCCVLLEYSSDNLPPSRIDDFIKLKEICQNNCIKIAENKYEPYENYISNFLPGNNKIDKEQLDRMIKEAFYNPALLKKMLYYFIDIGSIYQEGDDWFSDDLTFQLTAKLFEKHIAQRYDILSPELKNTLDKASITGYKIDSDLLLQPLGIIKAEENLRRIERLSRLIMHSEQDFSFENETVFNLISSKISLSEQKSQHLLIASHLYKTLLEQKKLNSRNPHILKSLYRISEHYQNADERDKALQIMNMYIYFANQQRNYDAAILAIWDFCKLSSGRFSRTEQLMANLATDIYIELGAFTDALDVLSKINKDMLPKGYADWLYYKQAFCLFNSGRTSEAQKIAESLSEKFDNHILEDDLLQIKLCILLSGMYHHFGNVRTASRRYEQACDIARNRIAYLREYNHLLSISNMFLEDTLAITQIEKAMGYFKEKNYLFSYAKSANNVAINYLYLYDLGHAANHLKESIRIFETECSTSAHYPQNNLATVYAMQEDYERALPLFEAATQYTVEPFSVAWITINKANCKRMQGDLEACRNLLYKADVQIHSLKENVLLLERNLKIAYALLAMDCGDMVSAYDACESALKIESVDLENDTYPVFLCRLLMEITSEIDKPLPELAKPYVHSFVNDYHRNLLEHHSHWGNFLFWEA